MYYYLSVTVLVENANKGTGGERNPAKLQQSNGVEYSREKRRQEERRGEGGKGQRGKSRGKAAV